MCLVVRPVIFTRWCVSVFKWKFTKSGGVYIMSERDDEMWMWSLGFHTVWCRMHISSTIERKLLTLHNPRIYLYLNITIADIEVYAKCDLWTCDMHSSRIPSIVRPSERPKHGRQTLWHVVISCAPNGFITFLNDLCTDSRHCYGLTQKVWQFRNLCVPFRGRNQTAAQTLLLDYYLSSHVTRRSVSVSVSVSVFIFNLTQRSRMQSM